MSRATRLAPLAVLGALLITGCASSVRIAEIKDQPDRYQRKTVSVNGVVTSAVGVSFVPFQVYNVDDGTGEISVVSRTGRSPSKGTKVRVKGKVNEVAAFGGRSLGLHIQEDSRKITD